MRPCKAASYISGCSFIHIVVSLRSLTLLCQSKRPTPRHRLSTPQGRAWIGEPDFLPPLLQHQIPQMDMIHVESSQPPNSHLFTNSYETLFLSYCMYLYCQTYFTAFRCVSINYVTRLGAPFPILASLPRLALSFYVLQVLHCPLSSPRPPPCAATMELIVLPVSSES